MTKRDALTDAGIHESILPCFRKRSTGTRPPSIKKASELRLSPRSFFMAGRSGALSGAPLSFLGGRSKPVRPATRTRPLVAGFGKDQSKRGYAMSQGVKGNSTCEIFNVLLNQEHSIAKLNHFINAAEALIGTDTQASLQFALFDGCRDVIRELIQQNELLHASRPLKKSRPARSKRKKTSRVSKGRVSP